MRARRIGRLSDGVGGSTFATEKHHNGIGTVMGSLLTTRA